MEIQFIMKDSGNMDTKMGRENSKLKMTCSSVNGTKSKMGKDPMFIGMGTNMKDYFLME